MARSARWLIARGYAALVAGFAIGDLLPTGSDELGIANAMGALVLGMLVAGILLLIGLVRGAQAIIRERHRTRWFDYVVLALGVAPFVFLLVALLPSK
jgi:ABC-type methionine transport system permease subunit